MTKPFHYPELLARIGALLKRVSRVANRDQLRVGDLVVNTLSKQVTVGWTGCERPSDRASRRSNGCAIALGAVTR